jgi:hypothetical protein
MRVPTSASSWIAWATPRPAALIYLHGSDERQQAIAAALSQRAAAELEEARAPKGRRDEASGQHR